MEVDDTGMPVAQGLYDPWYEKAACGVGYVVNIDGKSSHKVSRNTDNFIEFLKAPFIRGC